MPCAAENRHTAGAPPAQVAWPFPLTLIPDRREPLTPRQAASLVWLFVALGIAARLVRYLLRFPLWEDECFLSANLLDRGYLGLLAGLDYKQVCPPGFLWVQLSLVKLLGFHEYSLRLFALASGLASLFLFRRLARRFLTGTPLVLAVAIFAVAYPGIRYAAEAKQYGSDLFFSLLLTTLAVEWWRSPGQRRWLWGLAALIPVAVAISHPAVFVGGGISLLVAWVLWTRRPPRAWLPWMVYNSALVGTFGLVLLVSSADPSRPTLEFMQDYWQGGFPPVAEPLKLLAWLAVTHASDLLAYPFGGRRGGSILTLVCCLAGVWALCRRRQYFLLLVWLAPLGLNFIAAAMHRYPYGQMTKFQVYMAPAFCLLAGIGAAMIALGVPRREEIASGADPQPADLAPAAAPCLAPCVVAASPAGRRARVRAVGVLLGGLALFGAGSIARDFSFPAKSAAVMRARDFARWFWRTAEFDGEVACLKTDLDRCFAPEDYRHGLSAMYLCNQRIYSQRHARGQALPWERVAGNRALRCVEYHSTRHAYDEAARQRWLAEMQSQYDLVGRERYPFVLGDRRGREPRDLDYLEIYKFLPRDRLAARSPLREPSTTSASPGL